MNKEKFIVFEQKFIRKNEPEFLLEVVDMPGGVEEVKNIIRKTPDALELLTNTLDIGSMKIEKLEKVQETAAYLGMVSDEVSSNLLFKLIGNPKDAEKYFDIYRCCDGSYIHKKKANAPSHLFPSVKNSEMILFNPFTGRLLIKKESGKFQESISDQRKARMKICLYNSEGKLDDDVINGKRIAPAVIFLDDIPNGCSISSYNNGEMRYWRPLTEEETRTFLFNSL